MNLFYLKCFYDAALMGSVSESARRNFVSQSAVSQAIAKLEKSLAVPLCHHKKLQFKLTVEGEIVLQQARAIFFAIRNLQDALDQQRNHPQMPLHFVATHSIGLSLLPDFIPAFKRVHNNVNVHFQFGGITQIKGWLKQGIAEFALVLESPHVAEYQQARLYSGQFGLYKHKKECEEGGVYVEHEGGLMVPEFQEAYIAFSGKPLKILAEMNSWELIARSLETSGGYGLIPDLITLTGRYPHLVRIPKPALPYSLSAISPKGAPLSYSARTFLEMLKEFLSTKSRLI